MVEKTISQLNDVYGTIDSIIEGFDDGALRELFSGSTNDIDSVIKIISEEVEDLYFNKKAKVHLQSLDYLPRLMNSVDETLKELSLNYFTQTTLPEFEMSHHHVDWGNLIMMYNYLCVIAVRDHCFGKGTVVRMFDGSLKKIEEIVKGDQVMGPDFTKRTVLSIHSGIDEMYKVDQYGGIPYTVNSSHDISLVDICNPRVEFKEINVLNYKKIDTKRYKGCKIFPSRMLRSLDLDISSIGQGEYYGFECDGDHRFLLEDGTVVHNSKSFTFSFAYPIWKMFRYKKADLFNNVPLEFQLSRKGMIVTNEHTLAKELLTLIREGIDGNDYLREKLKPSNPNHWGKEEITCSNGANLMTKSFGSKIRGFHPGYFVIDDFLNDQVLYSVEQKEKYHNIFTSVIRNAVLPGGQIIVCGTPFIQGDLYDKLKEDPKFRVFEYPGIFPNGEVLWPSRYSLDDLLVKKETQGSTIFSREILVKPISDESSIFPYEDLRKSFIGMNDYTLVKNRANFPKDFEKVIVGTDFAISDKIGADSSAFVVVGVAGLDYWVLHIYAKAAMSYEEQMAVMKQINANFQPDLFMIETNQMQKIFYQMALDAGLPAEDHNTGVNKYSLTEGLPGLAIAFQQGHVKMPRGDQNSIDITDMLCQQLNSFTFDPDKKKLTSVAEHDDIAMALWQGMRGARHVSAFTFSFI